MNNVSNSRWTIASSVQGLQYVIVYALVGRSIIVQLYQ